jgi:hypothetical protein
VRPGVARVPQLSSKACVGLNGGRSQEIELRLDKGQQVSVDRALARLVPTAGPADPAFPLLLDGRSGAASAVATRNATAFRVQARFVTSNAARVCGPASAFTDSALLAIPSLPRNPDVPTFCSTAADIQRFLARLPFEGRTKPRADTARRIDDVLLPLLSKAQRSTPMEVAASVDAFTQAVRASIFTGKKLLGEARVDDAARSIDQFMMTSCGHPTADITGQRWSDPRSGDT